MENTMKEKTVEASVENKNVEEIETFEEVKAKTKVEEPVKAETKKEKKKVSVKIKETIEKMIVKAETIINGFCIIATLISVGVSIYFYATRNTGYFTIQLPTLNVSYFKVAVLAGLVLLGVAINTGKKKSGR